MSSLAKLVTAAIVLSAVLFFAGALAKFGQNDFMYAIAPAFWSERTLYRDLMFVQAPGTIYVYGALYQIVDPASFYLVLRVFSLIVLLLASAIVYWTARLLAGRLPALSALLFLYTSHFVAAIAVDAGATSLALFFLTVAYAIYVARPKGDVFAAAVGLSIGLAATMKLNFALFAIPFGLFVALRFGARSREVLWYIAGGIIGSSLLWYHLLGDFTQFWFFNIRFHALMNLHRVATGQKLGMSLLLGAVFFFLYAAPVIYLGIKAATTNATADDRRRLLELTVLLGTSLIAAYAPAYYSPQYLATPVFILSLILALALKGLVQKSIQSKKNVPRPALFLTFAWVLLFWIQIFPFSLKMLAMDGASPLQIRMIRDRIDLIARSHLEGTSCAMTAVSLSPVPLLGTAFTLPPINSSGPFVPIVSPQLALDAPEFAHYGLTRDTLARLRPTAFLVGYFPSVAAERILLEYARENKFIAFDVGSLAGFETDKPNFDMQLLVQRTCMGQPVKP
jgi:hypothetical protein